MSWRHRTLVATTAAVGLVLLAACTSSPPAPDQSDPPTGPTTSPSPTAPTSPTTSAGPTAFHDQEPAPADPATPAAESEQLAEQLGGTFLPVEGRQHGAMLVGMSGCVDGFLADYLIDLETPAPGSTCALPGQEPEVG